MANGGRASRFIVNKEVVLKDFFQQINKKIKESNLENIYYYNENGELIHALAEKHMEELYNELKNQDDGFIYIYYTDKNLLVNCDPYSRLPRASHSPPSASRQL